MRRTPIAALAAAGLVLGTWALSAAKKSETVRATRIELVDQSGAVRATLQAAGGHAGLHLEAQGKVRASLVVTDAGVPSLLLHDAEGRPRALFALDAEGEPLAHFVKPNGKPSWKAP